MRDYSVLRGPLTREYEVNMEMRAANRTSLMIQRSHFPLMPVKVLSAMPPQALSARLRRVACYFSLRVRNESDDVRMRYDAAFMIKWAHSVATALTLEIENHRRVWTCSDECIAFLSRFKCLDDFLVYCVGRFVSCVSFRSLVGQLRRVYLPPLISLVSRLDYPSGATVTWVVVKVVLRRVNVVGRTLVSIMVVVVAKGNAIIVIVMTTIFMAVPPGVELVLKRTCS